MAAKYVINYSFLAGSAWNCFMLSANRASITCYAEFVLASFVYSFFSMFLLFANIYSRCCLLIYVENCSLFVRNY